MLISDQCVMQRDNRSICDANKWSMCNANNRLIMCVMLKINHFVISS